MHKIDEARALVKDALETHTYSSKQAGDLTRKQTLEKIDELLGGDDNRPWHERMGAADAVVMSALVLLDREMRKGVGVRLSKRDIEAYDNAPPSTGVQFREVGHNGDIMLSIKKPEHDA